MTVEAEQPVLAADFGIEEITGRWRSPSASEVFPGIYGIDDFWLQSPFWGIHFNSYSDEQATSRLFELFIMGTFELLGENPQVPGARDANFSRVKVGLTLHSPALITTANEAGAGNGDWRIGQWQDVSFGGCAPLDLPGIESCPLEYDLLGLARLGAPGDNDNRLYFGQRHHDADGAGICDRRAPGLLPFWVERVVGTPPAVGHGATFGPSDWTHLTSALTPAPPTQEENPR